jgi:hypothetical protein
MARGGIGSAACHDNERIQDHELGAGGRNIGPNGPVAVAGGPARRAGPLIRRRIADIVTRKGLVIL